VEHGDEQHGNRAGQVDQLGQAGRGQDRLGSRMSAVKTRVVLSSASSARPWDKTMGSLSM
jgi:hypothetical protein